MSAALHLAEWDIFCNVVDNFGDIGVCWRLARQLVAEHQCRVRLWVDELGSFQRICPDIDPDLSEQVHSGVNVRRWGTDFSFAVPGDVVVETFACRLPERFIEAMAACAVTPIWINLDYLSAEKWVSGCHGLPSPHPQYPLTKFFFFPGFDETTGGLLRERDLCRQREEFRASAVQRHAFWHRLQQLPPAPEVLVVSLFAYENPSLNPLLSCWANGNTPVCCLMPAPRAVPSFDALLGKPLALGEIIRSGNLEVRVIPFVPQVEYDLLLWSCDINFVRGEDSFVRAQWAAKPMVWQIYPQDEGTHLIKLDAFLDRYVDGMPRGDAESARRLFRAWNNGRLTQSIWTDWIARFPAHRRHAAEWEKNLRKQEDLCSSLVRFCLSKVIMRG